MAMDSRLNHRSKIQSVALSKMRVRNADGMPAQRQFRPHHKIFSSEFDIDKLGYPAVNKVGDVFWVVDGQHRVEAAKRFLGEWEGQSLECAVYRGLSIEEESELFLDLNNVKSVSALDKYRVAITAGRHDETNTDAIVRKHGLHVSKGSEEGAVGCVGVLLRVFRHGAVCLDRDLRIVHEAFGDSGLEADVLDGIGMLVSRYNGQLDDEKAIRALSSVRGGVNSLRTRAARLRNETGSQRSHCVAAAAVEIINRGKGGKKLPSWWKSEAAQ